MLIKDLKHPQESPAHNAHALPERATGSLPVVNRDGFVVHTEDEQHTGAAPPGQLSGVGPHPIHTAFTTVSKTL